FHMPGHKRRVFFPDQLSDEELRCMGIQDIIGMDITEIRDYDNLHHPEGMILESMEELRKIYQTRKTWYLVNGSTAGILASISAVCQPGDEIIIARNCHKSVYNAIRLLHLTPLYLYPEYSADYDMFLDIGEKQREEIRQLLEEHPHVRAVLITSPTYEGIVSDVSAIKEVLTEYRVPLIVDEAHGAHFIFHDSFPKSAVECGADLVVQSVHKTLPCVTQTALLHLCSDLISEDRIQEMLSIYETSSPSYLLMASAEYGIAYTHNHPDKVQEYVDKLMDFRRKCAQLKHISLYMPEKESVHDYDIGKLVFLTRGTSISGKELFRRLLEDFHIECEMEAAHYCIAMTSINDTAETFDRLADAIFTIDHDFGSHIHPITSQDSAGENDDDLIKTVSSPPEGLFSRKPRQCKPVWEVLTGPKKKIALEDSPGRIVADYLYLYPPGIPVLVPGEKITKEIVANLKYYLYNGYNVPALSEGTVEVAVCPEDAG
ncbi:MAG: aminotransferase class I/II-fold pyridoxal phosphate-dependent enzyme, partial [Eubacterium sp.]|nr:aminotransferase class I/II-fold pyridoxal phosphate-dependent enzyme [Eubacterium sp.]